MNKLYLSLFCVIGIIQPIFAQKTAKVIFKKNVDTVYRQAESRTYPIVIVADSITIPTDSLSKYNVIVKSDDQKTSLPLSAYTLDFNSLTLDKLKSTYTFFLTIKPDNDVDRMRNIILSINVVKAGEKKDVNTAKDSTILNIAVGSSRALNKYSYLAYIGTNFDMIDGVKAKDLFFATNIYAPPLKKNERFGFSLTLYGNRTLSTVDSSRTSYNSKIVAMGGDTARFYTEEATKTVSQAADNLGATFSPMFTLGSLSDSEKQIQIYYSPQLEFIWRRIKMTTAYTNPIIIDSLDRPNRPITGTLVITKPIETTPLNIYDVYLGLAGVALRHENESISIRIQASMGVNYNYTKRRGYLSSLGNDLFLRQWNWFSYVRAWITEPTSGITFGAEVSNNLGKNYRPYYNVTLSKAINLSSLGTIFKPIASR